MCPSGTLRYIKDIEDIALDLTEVIEEKMRADDGRILSPNEKIEGEYFLTNLERKNLMLR